MRPLDIIAAITIGVATVLLAPYLAAACLTLKFALTP
jgi:hypothetical protein